MPVLWPPSTPLITGAVADRVLRTNALYYDLFDEVLGAGSVDGTDSTDENALRHVYDTLGDLSLNNVMTMDNNAVGGDPSLWHTTLVPGPWTTWNGYAFFWTVKPGPNPAMTLGIDDDLAAGVPVPAKLSIVNDPPNWSVKVVGSAPLLTFAPGDTVHFLIVRRNDSAGYHYLFRQDTDDWRLFWMDDGPLTSA